mgnify:CR=1 FL=1
MNPVDALKFRLQDSNFSAIAFYFAVDEVCRVFRIKNHQRILQPRLKHEHTARDYLVHALVYICRLGPATTARLLGAHPDMVTVVASTIRRGCKFDRQTFATVRRIREELAPYK